MAINFPASPTDGDTFVANDVTYQYNATLGVWTVQSGTSISNVNLASLTTDIIPDTDITYDLGSATNRFKDLFLSGNTITLGDQTISTDTSNNIELSSSLVLNGFEFNLIRPIENLVLNVHAPGAGGNPAWLWSWEANLLYDRVTVENSNEASIPLYRGSTYTFINFAYTLQGSMTQAHKGHLKSIEGTGTENLVPGFVKTIEDRLSPFTGQTVEAEVITWTVPEDFDSADVTLVQPSGAAYGVTNDGAGAYLFGATAAQQAMGHHATLEGTNPTVGPIYRGSTYTFEVDATGHPFYFTTDNGDNFASGQYVGEYTTGVTGSRTESGTITFAVPVDAPDTLYYQCGNHSPMRGAITIRDVEVIQTGTGEDKITEVYFQHSQESHVTALQVQQKPALPSSACIVFNGERFILSDMVAYYNDQPEFQSAVLRTINDQGYIDSLTNIESNITPATDIAYDLGAPSQRFRDLYLSGNSITLGTAEITSNEDGDVNLESIVIGSGDNRARLSIDTAGGLKTELIDGTGPADVVSEVKDEYRTTLYQPGELQTITGTERWYANEDITITNIVVRLAVAADDLVGIIMKKVDSEGTTNQDLSLGANATKRELTDLSITMGPDDYLTVDVTSIGSTTIAEDLNVVITYIKN